MRITALTKNRRLDWTVLAFEAVRARQSIENAAQIHASIPGIERRDKTGQQYSLHGLTKQRSLKAWIKELDSTVSVPLGIIELATSQRLRDTNGSTLAREMDLACSSKSSKYRNHVDDVLKVGLGIWNIFERLT